MGLATSIVWVLTIIAMGIAYAVIMNEKPKNKDGTQNNNSAEQSEQSDTKETANIK